MKEIKRDLYLFLRKNPPDFNDTGINAGDIYVQAWILVFICIGASGGAFSQINADPRFLYR